MPIADDFLRQAAERTSRPARNEKEQHRKEAKEWGSVGFKVSSHAWTQESRAEVLMVILSSSFATKRVRERVL
jgi:hypothetical protein